VAPLLQTKWSQGTARGQEKCFNYSTPYNRVCGCVATAMAQFMRYWRRPRSGIGRKAGYVKVVINGKTQRWRRYTFGGNGSGGAYDWSNMPLTPHSTTATAYQRQQIGRLCADAGTAIGMKYKESSSGANTAEVDEALKKYFKYRNGLSLDSQNKSSLFTKPIRTNLQADRPVFLSIKRSGGGHAILCDGYGYSSGTLYHHLNMGWGNSADAWYNLPTIDPPNGSAYSMIRAVVYNVSPSAAGEIICGRVRNSAGSPISGASIRVQRRNGGAIHKMTSDSRGYFGTLGFPSRNRYNLWVTRSGYRGVRKSNVYLGRSSSTRCQNYEWYPVMTPDAMEANLLLSRMEWDIPDGRIRFGIRNRGPKNVSGLNKRMRFNVYLSSDRRRGDADDRYIGGVTFNWTVASGSEQRLTWRYGSKISVSGVPPGTYYVYGKISHRSPSKLTDPRMADNYRWRAGRVSVSSKAGSPPPDAPDADLWVASAASGEGELQSTNGESVPGEHVDDPTAAELAVQRVAPPGVDEEFASATAPPPASTGALPATASETECDMAMSDLTFLPRTLQVGQYPTSVTYKVHNQGPADLEGTNTPVRFNFYLSSNTTFGDGDDIILGEAASNPEILADDVSSRLLTSNGLDNLVIPDEAFGTYYLFIEGMHVLPSALEDPDPSNDYAQLPGTVFVPENTMVADLGVTNFTFLPEAIETGAHPTSVAFRVTNDGPHDLEGSNQAFRLDFYLSRNEEFGDGDDIMIGEADASWAVAAGSHQSLRLTETGLEKVTVPDEPSGNYHVFLRVRHLAPSLLRDQSPDNDYTLAAGSIHVTPAPSTEADVALERLAFLPDSVGAGTRSTSVTYRVTNHGPRDIEKNVHTLRYEYVLSRNAIQGDSDDVPLTTLVSSNATIGAGAYSDRYIVGGLLVPAEAWGQYNVFCAISHEDGSPLSDPDPDNDAARCPHPVTVTGSTTLGEALDGPGLNWSTAGDSCWYSQADETHDGSDAARSGDNLPPDARSQLQCPVEGPGTVSFWWKVSSEEESDWLRFSIGKQQKAAISGTNASIWVQESVAVPAGTHTLTWSYDKDRSEGEGEDAAWVDQVSYVPSPPGGGTTAPALTGPSPVIAITEPTDRAVFTEPATFAITADTSGSPEPVVQVQFYANGSYLGIDTYADTNRFGFDWVDVPVGSYTLVAEARTAAGGTTQSDPVIVRVSPQGLVLSMAGEADWFEQGSVTYSGDIALQSGAIDHDETSVVDTTLEGPGVMQFWWKVSSEATFDRLRFYEDGEESYDMSGEADWAMRTVNVPDGTHTFTWSYDKDFSVTNGADAAWLDELEWFPAHVDTDGDGHSDLQEHWSGTDHTNYHSCLKIESVVAVPGDGEVRVEWQSRAGRQYRVERATVLSEGAFAPIETGIQGQDGTTTHTDRSLPPGTPAYYRVRIE
jgi:hypothetical protein